MHEIDIVLEPCHMRYGKTHLRDEIKKIEENKQSSARPPNLHTYSLARGVVRREMAGDGGRWAGDGGRMREMGRR